MKKYILGLFLVGFLLTPAFSFAQVGDIDPNPTASDCVALQNNLRYRDRDINKNGEVSTLQDFLQSKGYLNSEPTGYFGLLTFKAVKDFQKANDISPTGYVGPITRAKIKSLTCDGTVPTPDEGNGCLLDYLYSPMTGKRCSETLTGPVISGISGPQTLNVNQTGTWTVKASSPSGGALSYSVDWGDVAYATCAYGVGCAVSPKVFQQSVTFTHSYSQAGTYTPTFTVTSENTIRCVTTPCPSNEGSAQKSLSVNVGGVIATNRPQSPFNVRVAEAIISEGSAKIYWENVNGEKFYIYKNKNDGPFQFLAVTNEKFYKDTSGLGMDIKYGYYVTALNSYGESDPSKKVYVGPISMSANPVISGVSGPQTLNVNQTGTWTVKASSPSGGNLSYSVDWGDQGIYGASATQLKAQTQQSATFTHVYANTGIYTPTFTITSENTIRCVTTPCPSNEGSAQISTTVNVGNTPSITVLSPNGGETWIKGVTKTIKWQYNSTNPTCPAGAYCVSQAPKQFDIKLVPYYTPCTTNPCPLLAYPYHSPYIIANNVSDYTYSWTVGKITGGIYGVSDAVPDGSYAIQVCVAGSDNCDSSDSYFKITSSTSSGPVISGISGPQTLNVNQTGTWTVKASSASGGNLSYSVDWGDEVICPINSVCGTRQAIEPQQSATFTHSYSQEGLHKPIFTVTSENTIRCITTPCPSNGGSAQTSLNVKVKETKQEIPMIYSLSPNVGVVGSQVTIYGSGFTLTGNKVKFSELGSENNPSYSFNSYDGRTLTFTVPSGNYLACWYSTPACGAPAYLTPPGTYQVSVINSNGTSNAINFNVVVIMPMCDYAAPPQGCSYIQGPNYNSTNGCGLILSCPDSSLSANVLSAFDSASGNVRQEPEVINYSAPSSSCPEFTMTLRMGMNNSEVKCLQKMLNEKGFKVEGVETGGGTTYFGLATLTALKAFQLSNNLIVDGVFGVNSRAALKK